MRTPNPLERSALKVEHIIRATHAATGEPIAPIDAQWKKAPPRGKQIKVIGGTVIVAMDQRMLPPIEPGDPPLPAVQLELVVPEGPLARRLSDRDKIVDLDAIVQADPVTHDVEFEPIPMTLAVDLVQPGAGPSGGPSTGKTVEARAANATRVALPEVPGQPGTYRSAARVWSAGFNPLDLLVGNTLVRRIALDFGRIETRVTVVDPT